MFPLTLPSSPNLPQTQEEEDSAASTKILEGREASELPEKDTEIRPNSQHQSRPPPCQGRWSPSSSRSTCLGREGGR